MLPENHGVAFGVSVSPTDPTKIFIWMDNRTEVSRSYSLVCNVSYLSVFVVFDSQGNRRLTKTEEERRKSRPSGELDLNDIEECFSCCIIVPIAPHAMQVVDYGDLLGAYALQPGRYFLAPVRPGEQKPPSPPKSTLEIFIPDKK